MLRPLARLGTVIVALLLTVPPLGSAWADPNPPAEVFDHTDNLEPLGWAPRDVTPGINSDLAFWEDTAYQGSYSGFHIVDISNPEDPQTILDYNDCAGNQGDVIIWETLLVRSWNSPAGDTATCDGEAVEPGFEGIHIFDVSNPLDPDLLHSVETEGGSHTATGVPDPQNDRLIVYSNPGFDIIEIPLTNPTGAAIVGAVDPGRTCHDVSVILGAKPRVACAGGNGFSMLSLGGARGGSLTEPVLLYSHPMPPNAFVTIGHAATFSWDGSIVVFGHEPGGGTQPMCTEAADATKAKTMYFFYTETGTQIGEWTLPRAQTANENCTIHNFNVVPTADRNIVVSGNYQSGTSVVDFTNPGNPVEIAYADPAPIEPRTTGGDWSTHWYNGIIYQSDITRGLLTWRLNDAAVATARPLHHLNPQTQEEIIPFTGEIGGNVKFQCRGRPTTVFGTAGRDVLGGTRKPDVFSLGDGNDVVKGKKGNDIVCAGRGNDRVRGGAGKDLLRGQGGRDRLIGGRGRDKCVGGPGPDRGKGCERGKV